MLGHGLLCEPVAPFIDAAFIGEGEEELPQLVLAWAALRRAIARGERTRLDALAELAATFPLYVPALYDTIVDEATGMVVVGEPRDHRVHQDVAAESAHHRPDIRRIDEQRPATHVHAA